MQHIQNVRPNPITAPIGFSGDLFANRHNTFSMTQINNDVTAVYALHNTIDRVTFAIGETGINGIFFRILHFLNDDLFGRLSRYSAEGGGVHFCTEAVANFAFRIQFASFFEADFKRRFGHLLGNILELKDFNFVRVFIVLDLNIHFAAKLFARSRF